MEGGGEFDHGEPRKSDRGQGSDVRLRATDAWRDTGLVLRLWPSHDREDVAHRSAEEGPRRSRGSDREGGLASVVLRSVWNLISRWRE